MVRKLHKIHCFRFLCTLCTVTVENSIVLLLFYICARTKIAVQKGLGTTCLFWLLVRGIPVLFTNNDIFRRASNRKRLCSVVWPYQTSFKKLCARSKPVHPPSGFFVHHIWSFTGFLTVSLYQPCFNVHLLTTSVNAEYYKLFFAVRLSYLQVEKSRHCCCSRMHS